MQTVQYTIAVSVDGIALIRVAVGATGTARRWKRWGVFMDIKALVRRVFLLDLLKGLRVTFSYQRPSATYTEQYPSVLNQRTFVNPKKRMKTAWNTLSSAVACPAWLPAITAASVTRT